MTAITISPSTRDTVRVHGYVILAVMQIMDVLTTWFILSRWGERAEGNPVVAWVIGNVSLGPAMVMLLAIKLTVVWALFRKQTGVRLISALYGLVLVNNLLFLVLWLAN